MRKFLVNHGLWLVYIGVAMEALCVLSGWGGNWLLLVSLLLIVAGIVAYVAKEKSK